MGNNALRRIINSETKWTDTMADRHKHNFCVETCVELTQEHTISYYHVMKCDKCNSFRCIGTDNNCSGFSKDRIIGLPVLKMYRNRKTIGFKGAIVIGCKTEK